MILISNNTRSNITHTHTHTHNRYDLEDNMHSDRITSKKLDVESKDTWDLVWAKDNKDLFAVMEKTYRKCKAEEPILYLCSLDLSFWTKSCRDP